MKRWTVSDSEDLYQIPAWGQGYFRVNAAGNMVIDPPGVDREIDLQRLVVDLRRRGIHLPVLVRFSDLIRARIETMVAAFQAAKEEYGFTGQYRGVYPIKVNQDAHVVRDFVRYARPHHLGLEAGSKPELMVVLAMLEDPEALIICNGYKDRAYVQMALLARKLGRNVIIVVEQPSELALIRTVANELGLTPSIGVRAKLTAKGAGRWQGSVGDRAKFGLTVREIVALVHTLRDAGELSTLHLLHFHIGSQVTSIRAFHTAMREATRVYTELVRLGAPMQYLDIGGGLGVDYDGSRTQFDSSMNYTVAEYASTVVAALAESCNAAGISHPDLVVESGRAMVAYHAALLFDVVGTTQVTDGTAPTAPADDCCEELAQLWDIHQAITTKNLIERYHDAVDLREQSLVKFNLGMLDIEARARVDALYFSVCAKLTTVAGQLGEVPAELEPLERALADTYYCNFSLFQSAPDSWAIGQLFPVVPIHRLDREPTRRAVLADLTCDSDGKLDRFIGRREVKRILELHPPTDAPYVLGLFLVGAYQEILGDLHNLFGDTHEVHVRSSANAAGYRIEAIVEGNNIREVLEYVSYDRKQLLDALRGDVEQAIEEQTLSPEEGGLLVNTYIAGLQAYTYLS